MANENVLASSLAEYLAPSRTNHLEEARQKWRLQVITDPSIEKKIRTIYVTLVGDKDMSGYSQFLRQLDDLFLEHRDEERSEDNDDKPIDKESEDEADSEDSEDKEDSEDDSSEENASMIPKQSRFISGILRSLAGLQGNKTVQAYLDGDVKRFARNWSELSNRMLKNCQNINRKSGKDKTHEKKMGRYIAAALTLTDKETN